MIWLVMSAFGDVAQLQQQMLNVAHLH